MKVLALYLPQFHRIKENDEWWGDGFTEWTAVRNADMFFEGHIQPKKPFADNYYDLLQKKTMYNQMNLMKKYGIDGICIYHYWFKDGRKILEKPVENLLKWKELDIPFCFSWANETWAKSWSNLNDSNSWSSKFEKKEKNESNGVLLEQKYGKTKDWESHFSYLLQFFKDDRYIKIDNKPVVFIHKVMDITCFENMIDTWNILARDNGFKGIYVIGKDARKSQLVRVDKEFICEPGLAMKGLTPIFKNGVRCFDYDDIWKRVLLTDSNNSIFGGFVNYDDTPRRGKQGTVIINFSIEKFYSYLSELMKKNIQAGNEFTVINAWNEWGEGMYVEPDISCGEGYLKAIKKAKDATINISQSKKNQEIALETNPYIEIFEKEKMISVLLDKWLYLKQKRKNIFDFYGEIKEKKIAIYGYGVLGKHLLDELEENGNEPVCIIDKNTKQASKYSVISLDDNWPVIDVVIVTAVFDYGYIYENICMKNSNIKVISLAHLLSEID